MVSQSPAASATSQRTSSAKNTQPNPFGYTGPGPNTANSSTTSSPIDTTSHGSIMICRNKHYPYIASYHGPWLSLPIELLQSLFTLNSEAAATSVLTGTTATPSPPIDPAIFANLIAIRRLVDEASELVIRAAGGGGLSSGGPSGLAGPGSGLWGGDGLGGNGPGSKLSAIRQQRLRELAVSKLARAYRIDEIATAVLTMQSASTMDDIAAKVLKRSPNHADAMYVHFFHEKIPSRMLAASTTSEQLDTIVQQFPGTPEYYRTRAMIRCFREEYPAGLRDFKMAIQLTKKHKRYVNGVECEGVVHGGVRSKLASVVSDGSSEALNGHAKEATNGKPHRRDGKNGSTAPPNLAIFENENCGNESQLYFLRGACFHQYAVSLIDRAIQRVNEAFSAEAAKKKSKPKKKKKNNKTASSLSLGSDVMAASEGPSAETDTMEENGISQDPDSGESTVSRSSSIMESPVQANGSHGDHTNGNTKNGTAKPKRKNSKLNGGSDPSPKLVERSEVATMTPITAYNPPDIAPAQMDQYAEALKPLVGQILILARRSIKDYVHFLSFYPTNLEPFDHLVGPSKVVCDENGHNSTPSSPSPEDEVEKTERAKDDASVVSVQEHGVFKRSYQEVSAEMVSSLPDFLMSIPAGRVVPSSSSCTHTNCSHTKDLKLSTAAVNGPSAALASSNALTKPNPTSTELDRTAALYNNPNSLSTILNTLLTPPTEAECKTPLPLGSYHPLLVETWYAIGINYLILGDWRTAAMWHHRVTEQLMDNVEGYPVFLPARSMSQADYAEILRFLRRLFVKEQVGSAIAKRASTGSTLGNGKVGDGGKNGNSIAGPASTGGSASGSTGYNKLLKQYPLHTKRADTLLVWLQSTVVPGGGLAGLEKLATATYGKGDVETELPRANKRK